MFDAIGEVPSDAGLPLHQSTRLIFIGTFGPCCPKTLGRGKIDGCFSITVVGPFGSSNM